ncbi:MAG: hypothetical protein EA424_08395 [Planctomycetaceae bacterium]|nr:MAG: hypothetical protein EA424_08395 [Planctomycetaceae bacterium]
MTRPLTLGPSRIGNWNTRARPIAGRIDEVAIWSRACEATEIQQRFAVGANH